MDGRNILQTAIGLLTVTVVLVGCGPQQASPAVTSVTKGPTVTVAPAQPTAMLTPVPPTATPMPAPPTFTPIPTNKVTISTRLQQPVVLKDSQVEVTVTEVSNVGNCVGQDIVPFTSMCIDPKYRDSYYLLGVRIAVNNLTDEALAFGTDSAHLFDEHGQNIDLHWCNTLSECLRGPALIQVPAGSTKDGYLIAAVLNKQETFTLLLVGAWPWKD